nr:cysteine-rich receptor-like protein kinase [Tanacetum cinerariifolium]
MKILSLNIQGLGHKSKRDWIKELAFKHKLNFLALQETKSEIISIMDIRFMWGNSNFQYACSDLVGSSGGILCVWEQSIFKKEGVMVSDNFITLYGEIRPEKMKGIKFHSGYEHLRYLPPGVTEQVYTPEDRVWKKSNLRHWVFIFSFIMGDLRSKEDSIHNISTSIFVTNFPDQTNAKELWRFGNQYRNGIDAFIPDRRSKIDFRPTSLIGCQSKIIGKILSNRLNTVIVSCISAEQSAFIKGRNILNGLLISNEVIDWYLKCKKELMIFKVDLRMRSTP